MNHLSFRKSLPALLTSFAWITCAHAGDANSFIGNFKSPPKETHPILWWRFMDDYATRQGMMEDLDAMKHIGLSGAVVSCRSSSSGISKPMPGAPFVPMFTPAWWENMDFTLKQAADRDLDLCFQLCPGYATSGGPWITPELSMQKLVWSQANCSAEKSFDDVLPTPKVDKKWNYYRDVAVLAFPDGKGPAGSKSKVELFFDSWEAQNQNWTPTFREEFKKRRGYDPLPWLLVATKRIVGREELSRRFDYDGKTTIEELINDNHFQQTRIRLVEPAHDRVRRPHQRQENRLSRVTNSHARQPPHGRGSVQHESPDRLRLHHGYQQHGHPRIRPQPAA
jgi:hypothetical protein